VNGLRHCTTPSGSSTIPFLLRTVTVFMTPSQTSTRDHDAWANGLVPCRFRVGKTRPAAINRHLPFVGDFPTHLVGGPELIMLDLGITEPTLGGAKGVVVHVDALVGRSKGLIQMSIQPCPPKFGMRLLFTAIHEIERYDGAASSIACSLRIKRLPWYVAACCILIVAKRPVLVLSSVFHLLPGSPYLAYSSCIASRAFPY